MTRFVQLRTGSIKDWLNQRGEVSGGWGDELGYEDWQNQRGEASGGRGD